jgi:hypothetical protein
MYVFLSWAYVDEAQKAEEQRVAWLQQLRDKDPEGNEALINKLTAKYCLPEFAAYQQAMSELGDAGEGPTDSLNANLLAVRFVIPALEKVVTYQMAKRMPGDGKLPVSQACRSFLLNTFSGEWSGDLTATSNKRLIFVGLPGIYDLLAELALCCAALGEPLPIDLWRAQKVVELPGDKKLRTLVDACAFNQGHASDQKKYQDLILGWLGTGTSAERDSAIALATGFRLGLGGA